VTEDFARTPGGAVLMDGARLRDEIVVELRKEIEAAGSPPVCLATVLVGDDRPSQVYVRIKHRKAEEAGMTSRSVELPPTASQGQVEEEVGALAADPAVHGILVQLPLPDGLDPETVLDLLPPEKDVDGLAELSMGRLVRGKPGHVPCTPLGVMRLLDRYGVPTSGSRAVIVGRSTLVGLPLALLLARKGTDATVTLPHAGAGGRVSRGRHPRRRGRPGPDARPRSCATGRGGDRRRGLAHRGRARRRRRLRRRPGDRRCDHPDARRYRPDDRRLPPPEHPRGRPDAGSVPVVRLCQHRSVGDGFVLTQVL
jgi:hypothetical protein